MTSKSWVPESAHINTIAARISSPSFVRVSAKQLAVSSLSKGIQAHSIFTRALTLVGLEHATTGTKGAQTKVLEHATTVTRDY